MTALSSASLAVLLLGCLSPSAHGWKSVSVEDFGAIGDNATDNTKAFRAALAAVVGGGEVLVPASKVFRTAPVNLTSNVVFRVEGTMRAIQNRSLFPKIGILPSVGHDYDTNGQCRRHPFIFAVGGSNISVVGSGTIDGAGRYWWNSTVRRQDDPGVGRPHLMELQNITDVLVTGVTLLNSPFWTFHPVYCKNVHIHHIEIQIPWGGFNGDGIDVDSCQNVMIEQNFLNVGDDHVTILSGVGKAGQDFAMPSKNITVQDNRLGTGMGISIGSSVSGGIEDVLYARNVMNESVGQWGMGIHIKTRTTYGGYIRNVAYIDNYFETAGVPGGALHIESGYQSGDKNSCNFSTCTDIRDIVFRNLTFKHSGGTGSLACFPARPCHNITFEDVHVMNATSGWGCENIASGSFIDVTPPRTHTNSNCNFTMN